MLKYIKYFALMFVLWSYVIIPKADAATINAASCSIAHINAAIAEAHPGDTVLVPPGDCTWDARAAADGKVIITKVITLEGAGIGSTNITLANADPGIYNGIEIDSNINNWRISGFSFITSTPSFCIIKATEKDWRIDHCEFTGFHYAIYVTQRLLATSDNVSACIDNNTFYGGGIQIYGLRDAAWTEASDLGTSKFLFIEDNTFSDIGSLQYILHVIAMNDGARVVSRYNTIKMESTGIRKGIADAIDAHGICHGNNIRGTRAYEIYNNTFTKSITTWPGSAVYLRGGTGVVYNNTFLNTYGRLGAVVLYELRAAETGDTQDTDPCPGACSNTGRCTATYWRLDVTPNPRSVGFPNLGNGVVVTGATSGAVGTINSMASDGYLYFIEAPTAQFQSGEVLTVAGVAKLTTTRASELVNGEGYPCCDQVGRGQNQTDDPLYVWGNTGNTTTAIHGGVDAYFTDGVDYFSNTQKPGYTAYQYPHPLTRPQPPRNLRIISP